MAAAPGPEAARTLLFVPATRPDRVPKAVDSGADLVVVDLEDAVPEASKHDARSAVDALLSDGHRIAVRVNAVTTPHHADDLAMVRRHGCPVVLPKAEDPTHLAQLDGCGPVTALVETAAGLLAAAHLATHPAVVRLALGHLDLAAELGVDPDSRDALLWARSSLVLASAAAALAPPVDGVTVDVADDQRLIADVDHAIELGMGGKLCIHPWQVAPVAARFVPDDASLAWARSVVAAAEQAERDGEAVVAVAGRMVDRPVVERARRLLARSTPS